MKTHTRLAAARTAHSDSTGSALRTSKSRVYEIVHSPGEALDPSVRAAMERQFDHSFANVRVHADRRASESAGALDADAYTVGSHVVMGPGAYAPGTPRGRALLAHELTHVAQWERAGRVSPALELSRSDQPAEREADRAEAASVRGAPFQTTVAPRPVIHRKEAETKDVPFGTFQFRMEPRPIKITGGTISTHKEDVSITFEPNDLGPDGHIDFEQTVRINFDDPTMSWGQLQPEDAELDKMQTKRSLEIHTTAKGETLGSISLQHYGTEVHAARIFKTNKSVVKSADKDALLDPGLKLFVPVGGFFADLGTPDAPRNKRSEPNRSTKYGGSQIHGFIFKKGGVTGTGSKRPAMMTDSVGLTGQRADMEFESAARNTDASLYYGSARWGFRFAPSAITNEWVTISPSLSDEFRPAVVEANKYFRNKHKVFKGDTLRSIAKQYMGSGKFARMIYLRNRTLLKSDEPDTPLPPGTLLDIPSHSPTIWSEARTAGE